MNDSVGQMIYEDIDTFSISTIDLFIESLKTFELLLSSSIMDESVLFKIKSVFSLNDKEQIDIHSVLSFALGELTSLRKKHGECDLLYFCVRNREYVNLYCFNIKTSELASKEYRISSLILAESIFLENNLLRAVKDELENNPGYFLSHTSSMLCRINF